MIHELTITMYWILRQCRNVVGYMHDASTSMSAGAAKGNTGTGTSITLWLYQVAGSLLHRVRYGGGQGALDPQFLEKINEF